MFMVTTVHLVLIGYQLVFQLSQPVPASGLEAVIQIQSEISAWWNKAYPVLYVTQELLGSGAAIYRCWVLWHRNWKVIVLPVILLLAATGVGYIPAILLSTLTPLELVKDRRILISDAVFYTLTVVLNVLNTSLLVYPLWTTHRSSMSLIKTPSLVPSVIRILVESAMLQLLCEIVLLALFLAEQEAQYVLYGLVVPIVGITFTLITLRIKSAVRVTLSSSAPSSNVNSGRRRSEVAWAVTNTSNRGLQSVEAGESISLEQITHARRKMEELDFEVESAKSDLAFRPSPLTTHAV
ncbi:hypothetical protein V5O48_013583 [Marasmius crinis-equi]|uniref:Uncharacterized protein n=1 Tax=Marasmius crinis-equi TaxID=585013 RepID=A0ABR3EZP2_9AGAR